MGLYFANAKRTKRAIADAFIGLFEKKSFEKITIRNILTFAEIGRSTFYKYFLDKYDLARQITDALVDGYVQILIVHKEKPAGELFSHTYKFILENKREFKALLSIRNDEIDVFNEIILRLRSVYPEVHTAGGEYESMEEYYFAYIHFIAIYSLIINNEAGEDAAPPRASEYTESATGALLNVFSGCFNLDPKSLKYFIKTNMKV